MSSHLTCGKLYIYVIEKTERHIERWIYQYACVCVCPLYLVFLFDLSATNAVGQRGDNTCLLIVSLSIRRPDSTRTRALRITNRFQVARHPETLEKARRNKLQLPEQNNEPNRSPYALREKRTRRSSSRLREAGDLAQARSSGTPGKRVLGWRCGCSHR